MSQPRTNRDNKISPNADVYTAMLVIAFVMLAVGCVFLYLEVAAHGTDPLSGAASIMGPAVDFARENNPLNLIS